MLHKWLPLLAAAGFLALWAGLAFLPIDSRSVPGCQVRNWTGLHCPGCGGTRAARHLAKGRIAAAAGHNVLIFPIVAAMIWGLVAFAANSWAGKRWWTPQRITFAMALWAGTMVVVFTIVRNLDLGSFLRP